MAYTKYSLTPSNNTATPPDGAPEGMLPSAVNDTMRDMMAQIRDCGDGIRDGTYTMTAAKITGGTITGVAFTGNTFTNPVISGGSINNTPIGATTANTGAFTTLSASGATTFSGATVVSGSLTANTFSSSGATITGGTINGTSIGATTASTGRFSDLTDTGLTSGRVIYATTGGNLTDDADFTFNGTTVTMANDASISGLTVGKGLGGITSNTAVGLQALNANTSGTLNTAVGNVAVRDNTTGAGNSGFGYAALVQNTTGGSNTAIGSQTLFSNTTASNNTAIGYQASYANTTGTRNVAIGLFARNAPATGDYNIAIGAYATQGTGSNNVGVGDVALASLTTGSFNTSIGAQSLYSNTTASNNTAVGYLAGYSNTTGSSNLFVGQRAGYSVTTGLINTLIGRGAGDSLTTGSSNTFVGGGEAGVTVGAGGLITTGSKNTILGRYDGNQGGLDIRTASNYIVLSDGDGNPRLYSSNLGAISVNGNTSGATYSVRTHSYAWSGSSYVMTFEQKATSGTSYTLAMRFGDYAPNDTSSRFLACFDTSADRFIIYSNGSAVNATGSYGTISDVKNKENIVDATPKLDKINQLKVRNFNFKGDDLKQIGFVAQEFETVFPSMVDESPDKDKDGNDLGTTTKSIKTSVLVPILVKAVQELTAKVEALEAQLNK